MALDHHKQSTSQPVDLNVETEVSTTQGDESKFGEITMVKIFTQIDIIVCSVTISPWTFC